MWCQSKNEIVFLSMGVRTQQFDDVRMLELAEQTQVVQLFLPVRFITSGTLKFLPNCPQVLQQRVKISKGKRR